MKKRYEIIIAVLTIILALSGWGTIIFQNIQNKPKIEGEILIEINSTFGDTGEDGLIYSPYIFLTNTRNNTVYIKSIFLEYNYKGDNVRFEPDYTIKNTSPSIPDSDKEIGVTSFNDISNNSIFYKDLEVKFGQPLHGFVSFPMDIKHEKYLSESKYKLIIYDIFGREYIIKQKRKYHEIDFDWFEHFSGVKINEEGIINPQSTRTKY